MVRALKDYPAISIKAEDLDGKFDSTAIFGRTNPLHLEIGSGKGTFLVNQAKVHPEINYLGIEWANKYYRHTVDRIGRWALSNVRVIRTEAATFIKSHIPDASVECFHIYFPDPWPKRSHHKRRFFNGQNLDQLLRCLAPKGQIRLATDHDDYFQQMQNTIALKTDILKQIPFLPTTGADKGEWVGTNFERKYIKDNRSIYTLALKKI